VKERERERKRERERDDKYEFIVPQPEL